VTKSLAPTCSEPQSVTPGVAFVDGAFGPLDEASIPLLDWGFNKSDAVYDGIPFTSGRIFRLSEHLQRFRSSMKIWRLPEPTLEYEMADICHDLVARSGLEDGICYVCTTRGVPPSAEVRDPTKFTSRFYAWSQELPQIGSGDSNKKGLSLIVASVPRIPSASVDASAKNFHWGDLIQARLEAADEGADNALLLSMDGTLAEGVGFNAFIVQGDKIATPGKDCLLGVTRQTVLELADDLGVDSQVRDISVNEVLSADEIFISTSAGGVLGVSQVNGIPIGSGDLGETTKRFMTEYWKRRTSEEWSCAVKYKKYRCGS